MSSHEAVAQLRADIKRWRARLSEGEPTYCQGVANKAAKQFESILKRLAARRLATTSRDLDLLLDEIKYKGDARTIEKLAMGTVTQLILRLAEFDHELREVCTAETRRTLTTIVEARNKTTHELQAKEMAAATGGLLELIDGVLGTDRLVALL